MERYPDFQGLPSFSFINYYTFLLVRFTDFSSNTKRDSTVGWVSEKDPIVKPFSNPKTNYISELHDYLRFPTFLLGEMPKSEVIGLLKQKIKE